MKLSARFLFAWVAVVLFSHGASHAQVLVQNAGFEEPVLADGVFTTEDGPHWKLGFYDVFVDPALWILGDDDGGVWNPDAADGFSDGAAFAGQNAGWAISHTGFDAGLSPILDATLEPDTEYVLSVQAGNPFYNESDETAQYRIELLAGGVLLASDSGDSPVADTWELHSLTYNSADNPEEVGEELENRLIAVDYTDGQSNEAPVDPVGRVAAIASPDLGCRWHNWSILLATRLWAPGRCRGR